MKKTCLILLDLIVAVVCMSQTQQKGVTYRYNGKNPHTPLGNVYLKAASATNAVLSDKTDGTFTFLFQNAKMGSPIRDVKVTKRGMMIFNQQAVDEVRRIIISDMVKKKNSIT